jgi:hypothetical protein
MASYIFKNRVKYEFLVLGILFSRDGILSRLGARQSRSYYCRYSRSDGVMVGD